MISEKERAIFKRNARMQAAALCGIGIVCLLSQTFFGGVMGFLFIGLAIVFGTKGPEFAEAYVLKQRGKVEDFAEDKRGIIQTWIVALLAWAIMAIAYFSLSIVVYMVLDSIEAFIPWGTAPVWADQYLSVIYLTRNVTAWFLIIMTVGIIGWALLNSARRVADTGPAY